MAQIKAAIFDMDGLLVNSEPYWRQAEVNVFGQLGIHLSDEDAAEFTGIRIDEIVRIRFERQAWEGPSLKEVEEMITDELGKLVRAHANLLPGALDAINLCKEAGLRLAIASSSPMRVIEMMTTAFDLKQHFELLQSAEKEQWGKPHPAVYIEAAAGLGLEGANCFALEDTDHGVIAAKAARMKVVAVPSAEDFSKTVFGAADLKLATLEHFTEKELQTLLKSA